MQKASLRIQDDSQSSNYQQDAATLKHFAAQLLWCIPLSIQLSDEVRCLIAEKSFKVSVCWTKLEQYSQAEVATAKSLSYLHPIAQQNERAAVLDLRTQLLRMHIIFNLGQDVSILSCVFKFKIVQRTLNFFSDSLLQLAAFDVISKALAFVKSSQLCAEWRDRATVENLEALATQATYLMQSKMTLQEDEHQNAAHRILSLARQLHDECGSNVPHTLRTQIYAQLAMCSANNPGGCQEALDCISILSNSTIGHQDEDVALPLSVVAISFTALMQLERYEEAGRDMVCIVSHEDATPEVCAWAVSIALKSISSSENSVMMMEAVNNAIEVVTQIYPDDPTFVLELLDTIMFPDNSSSATDTGNASNSSLLSKEVEDILLDLSTNDRHVEVLFEQASLRDHVLALLWNYAVSLLGSSEYQSALKFFQACKQYIHPSDVTCKMEVAQSEALCEFELREYQQTLDTIQIINDEYLNTSVALQMLKYKAFLAVGSTEAKQMLDGLTLAGPGVLQVACVAAIDMGQLEVAEHALVRLLDLLAREQNACTIGQTAAWPSEAVLFHNLISLVIQQSIPGQDSKYSECTILKLSKYFDMAVERMLSIGAGVFYPATTDRKHHPEATWLAMEAWNAGIQASKIGMFQSSVVLLGSCGDLCANHPDSNTAIHRHEKLAYLMAGSGALDVHRNDASYVESLALAKQYLQAARRAYQKGAGASGSDGDSDGRMMVYLCLQELSLALREKDDKGQQEAVSTAVALENFTASNCMMMVAMFKGKCRCMHTRFAFKLLSHVVGNFVCRT